MTPSVIRAKGSGADLTVRAIASLPQDLADCLTLVIHDEIGLHMPPNAPDGALVALEQVMNKAGMIFWATTANARLKARFMIAGRNDNALWKYFHNSNCFWTSSSLSRAA